jgi:RNA polymerase sigma factor (sigma-70 family)
MTPAEYYKANLGLVHSVSRKGFSRLATAKVVIDYEDVFQEMSIVFLKAFEKFDESKGFKFSTYYFMCAYNRLNRWAQDLIEERLKHGVVSIEELGQMTGEGDDFDMSAAMTDYADPSTDPESSYRVKELLDHMLKTLSPLAGLILEWSIAPPDEVMTEVRKAQDYAAYGRSQGHNTRCMVQVSPRYVASFIRMVSDVTPPEVAKALKEIEDIRYADAKHFVGA